jgi:hypothetical protein
MTRRVIAVFVVLLAIRHYVYLFHPERGPAPAAPADAAEKGGRGRGPQGPVIAGCLSLLSPQRPNSGRTGNFLRFGN